VFGELFRATGWRRDEVVAANKLWWEHWPDNVAAVATSSRRNDDRIARIRPFAI